MHVMIDIETFGLVPGVEIRSIGAVAFRHEAFLSSGAPEADADAYIEYKLNVNLWGNVPETNTYRDPKTVDWWADQNEAARAAFEFPAPVHPYVGIGRLVQFIEMISPAHVWAMSPSMDIVLLEHYFRQLGMSPPWNYRMVRDVRTRLADAGVTMAMYADYPEFLPQAKHVAVDDARAQAVMVMIAAKRLGIKE